MNKPELRIYRDAKTNQPATAEASVKLKLRDLFPLLIHAHRHNYAWLRDMESDEILVTQDLAEILKHFAEIISRKKGA